jgi:hypothetical protein
LLLHEYWFGLAAAPFSAAVWPDNGVTLRFGLSRNVTRVWPFSGSGVNIRFLVLLYVYFLLVSVWTDQGGRGHIFVFIAINCYYLLLNIYFGDLVHVYSYLPPLMSCERTDTPS